METSESRAHVCVCVFGGWGGGGEELGETA